jgi:hypothetical protein
MHLYSNTANLRRHCGEPVTHILAFHEFGCLQHIEDEVPSYQQYIRYSSTAVALQHNSSSILTVHYYNLYNKLIQTKMPT